MVHTRTRTNKPISPTQGRKTNPIGPEPFLRKLIAFDVRGSYSIKTILIGPELKLKPTNRSVQPKDALKDPNHFLEN